MDKRFALLLLAALPACAPAPEERMMDDVRALADPAMKGRAEANGGAALAADWIEARFRDLGLATERVPYTIPRRRIVEASLRGSGVSLAPGKDFAPLIHSASATASGPFARGLAARISRDADSVRGAIAVEHVGPAPDPFRPLDPPLVERALAYQDLGAAGVVFIADAADPNPGGEATWAPGPSHGPTSLSADDQLCGAQSRAPRPSRPLTIPAALVSASVGRSLGDADGARLDLSVSIETRTLAGDDVLAILPGQSPAVLVTAHYDSHGFDAAGRLFPGACDNASGVAVLLAVAEALRSESLPRSVIFAACGGEELGLHGSRALAATLPAKRPILCDFNVDMAARGDEGEMWVVGRAFAPEVAEIARRSLERAGFNVPTTTKKGYDIDVFFRLGSDEGSFHDAGIPSVLFTCSRFPECDTPDDAAALCSSAKMRRVADAVVAAVRKSANRDGDFAKPLETVVTFPGEK